jgi:RND family efflux transporter MFP subunit
MTCLRSSSTLLFLVSFVFAACSQGESVAGGPGGPGGPPGGGMPAMGVETITLTVKPVERTAEYIATVKSRRSTTIQPQAEGFITRINVQSGQRVGRGTVLMTIDSGRQQAAVASLESMRAARQADVQFARQQADRQKKLFDAGAVSQQEYEQAATAVQTSQAQLNAIEAQIREQRVELGYYNVTAPTPGVVGDIPVRVGDRVSRGTELTTIDENAGLELYINVPVQQAPGLKNGLTVRMLDDAGAEMGSTTISFVAPSVDSGTQSVLAKAPLQTGLALRPDQFVRVRVVWTSAPALTVPLIAVSRLNAQTFVYVVEKDQNGATVAHQRTVQLGPIVGNDYVLLSGLKEGEQLVVAGVQKIGDGMPVQASPAGPASNAPSAPSAPNAPSAPSAPNAPNAPSADPPGAKR